MKLYVLSIFMVVIGVVGCSTDSPTLIFILPDGFKGLVRISEDKNNGLDLRVKNGEYTVEIPQSGNLVVRSFKPFNHWHKEKARYKSGETILDQTSTSATMNLFFDLPYVESHGIYYLVGTKEDYNAISKCDFHKLPLAEKVNPSSIKQ